MFRCLSGRVNRSRATPVTGLLVCLQSIFSRVSFERRPSQNLLNKKRISTRHFTSCLKMCPAPKRGFVKLAKTNCLSGKPCRM
jgi:hypothetical protein